MGDDRVHGGVVDANAAVARALVGTLGEPVVAIPCL